MKMQRKRTEVPLNQNGNISQEELQFAAIHLYQTLGETLLKTYFSALILNGLEGW